MVITELLSDPALPPLARSDFLQLPCLEILDGYWERAGLLRSKLLAGRRKARLADSLIAQSCIDHDVPLVTRDADFRNFTRFGLRIL